MQHIELDLDVYQGPFDLLFTLILREEVDICEVPLVEIILAYLERSLARPDVDWEGLTEFLVLIAALLEIKSKSLLPGFEAKVEDMDPEQARELLLARLVSYQQFKRAAESLGSRLSEQWGREYRGRCIRFARVRPPLDAVEGTRDVTALKARMDRLLDVRRGPDTDHLAQIRIDLPRQIAVLRRLVAARGRLSFDDVYAGREPLIQAVGLLALIDLLGRGEVDAVQSAPFGDIVIGVREVRQIA